MLRRLTHLTAVVVLLGATVPAARAQTLATDDPVLQSIWTEAMEYSQLTVLAHELLDVIGPRLVGTPAMNQANDWAVSRFQGWGISARNEQWGTWRGWQRGITHIDLVSPRRQSLEGSHLAWSPGTNGPVTAEVVALPEAADAEAFARWLPTVRGKFVMVSFPEPTGRPDENWEQFATPEGLERMQEKRNQARREWTQRIRNSGYNARTLVTALEEAGAAGIVTLNWSRGWGVNKVFGANTETIPTFDLRLEDYGLVYRLVVHGNKPELRVNVEAEFIGEMPQFNTIATIRGTEKPEEYIVLSAHFDSWDIAPGATDNGTGSITMMEAARILRKVYPNPKRTIIVGLWGSEEQGLNGSASFVEDRPEVIRGLQAAFNQDNGTGRVTRISGQGFLHAGTFLGRWLSQVPSEVNRHINLTLPGTPSSGGSDQASFVSAGVPGFSLSSISWDYGTYTWHTDRDTYDKLVFDELMNNVVLVASLAYLASEDPEKMPRDQRLMPINPRTGERLSWPSPRPPTRRGGGLN